MPKFLLDENVRVELDEFLESKKFDFVRLPSTTSDKDIAATSRREDRIVVTNDEDFTKLLKGKVFSVIWLRIPQKDVPALIASFQRVINECPQFRDKLVILYANEWKEFPLSGYIALGRAK